MSVKSRTESWVPSLGLLYLSVIVAACGSGDEDTGRERDTSTSPAEIAGRSGSSGQTASQAGAAGSIATSQPPTAGRSPIAGASAAGTGATAAGAGAGGAVGVAGASGRGNAGMSAVGAGGAVGVAGASGRGNAGMSAAGMSGAAGASGSAGAMATMGEVGRMAGMTAAHNAVRAKVQTTPPLPALTWSPTLATYAQQWADNLAMTACTRPMHRTSQDLRSKGYGENLAAAGGIPAPMTNAQWAVDGWAGEVACWTFGTSGAGLGGTEKCNMQCFTEMNSDGCGHYTQIIWRNTKEVGCGVASCQAGGATYDIWICNYSPPGNVVGQNPY
jgi:hypothetical protein